MQFVRRADAELAIAKMNDFPIHGKSRIRLSWGRSQGDKQVEHVRKLASALGVQFDAVWRMVQGQDNTTIKQIATAVGGPAPMASVGGLLDSLPGGGARMELGAVANAAGLTEAEVMDLVGGGRLGTDPFTGLDRTSGGPYTNNLNSSTAGGQSPPSAMGRYEVHAPQQEFYPRSPLASSTFGGLNTGGSPYSRVSPSTFSAFSAAPPSQNHLPLSPPPSAGPFHLASHSHQLQQQQHHAMHQQHPHQNYNHNSPYTSIRPESYLVHPPSSPYERVDFADGGVPHNAQDDRFQQTYQPYAAVQPTKVVNPSTYSHEQPQSAPPRHPHSQHQQLYQSQSSSFVPMGGDRQTIGYGRSGLEESFGDLNFSQSNNIPPPPSAGMQDFFAISTAAGTSHSPAPQQPNSSSQTQQRLGYSTRTAPHDERARWGPWSGPRDGQS